MKHVCISLAAALALAVPSFAQVAEETPFSCEVRTKYNQPGTSYSSLAEAVAAVPEDGTLRYVCVIGEGPAEITTPITVKAGQNISLYSEKDAITYNIPASLTDPVFTVESGARLTFTKYGKYVYGKGAQGTFLENYGYVSIASGTFTLDAGDSGVAIINHGGAEDNSMECSATVSVASGAAFRNDGVLTISSGTTTAESGIAVLSNGGTLTLSSSKGVSGSEGAVVVNGGKAIFEKGTISSTGSAPAVLLCASQAPVDASFKGTPPSLTSKGGDALVVDGSAQVCKVQINKGTFTPAEGKASVRVTHDTENADVTLSVVDGVFNAPIVSEGSAPIVGFILGGTFAAQPDPSLVADGLTFEQNADGLYAPTAVAQIGDAAYLTFKEAIAAATAGDTVKLLRDVSIPESTPITVYGLTIDLAGHTLTNTAANGSGIRLTLSNAEGTPADFTLVGPGAIVADTPIYASGAYNYARPYTVIVDESVILKSTVEGNLQIELSGSARVAATDANVTRLGQGGFKVNDGSAEWLYGTCAGAFLNVPEGGTFTLCQDFKGSSRLEFPIDPTLLQTRATGIVKSATLDLAGHAFTSTLDGNSADLIVIDSGADVTIKGGSLTAIGDLAHMALPEDNNGNAALTLEDVTATSSSDDYLIVSNGSTDNINITVRDSTLTATGANTVAIFAPAGGDSTVTLDNAIIKSPYGVQVCAGDLFVKGNTQITTTAANVTSTKTGDGPIPDGAAISIVNRAGYGDAATTGSSVGKVTIEGSPVLIAQGKGAKALDVYAWDSASAQQDWPEDAEHVTIFGGTFSEKPDEALLAPDFVLVENQDGTFGVASAYVASIGEVKYADFNSFLAAFKAIAASETPTTVTLLADLTGDRAVPGVVTVVAGQNIVFDLNGHTMETTLKEEGRHHYAIDNYGTLTIKDSSTEQTGTIRARGVENLDNGKLTIESGTIVSVDANGGACIWNEADVTVKGGTFKTKFVGTPSDEFGPGCLNNSGTALVTGGTFHNVNRRTYAIISNTGSIEITPAEGSEVKVFGAHGGLGVDGGTAVVNGGTYSSSDYYGLYVSNDGLGADPMQAAVTVNGGTFDGETYSVLVGSDYNNPVNSTIAIKGGTFLKPLHRQDVSRPDAIQVSGGTFSEKPDNAWFADGFIPVENADGTFGVAPGSFAAEIAGVKYLTLKEAIAAVPANGAEATTITLLDDVTSAGSLPLTNGQKAILNMNGKTVTFSSGKLQLLTSASLTLTGEGSLVCQTPSTGAISIYGNETSQIDLLVDSAVTVNGHYGIALFGNGASACRNVTVTVKGTVKTSEGGSALYVNGTVNNTEGSVPQIILAEGATVEAASVGIHAAGYAKWNLAGTINADYAISIKCGDFTITGGSYTSTGNFVDPAEANSNGTEDTGAAISITTNPDYAQKTNVTITGGTFTSTNGYAFYEGIAVKDGQPIAEASTAVIAIQGGDFTGNADLGADIAITTAENKQVVSGGMFSQPVELGYCADGYIPTATTVGDVTTYGVKATDAVAVIAKGDGTYTECATIPQAVGFVPANVPTTIIILQDITNCGQTKIEKNKNVTIDLNGHNITFAKRTSDTTSSYPCFTVKPMGHLTLTGTGTVSEFEVDPFWTPICVNGSGASDAQYACSVTVDENVTLKGWSGIVIDPIAKTIKAAYNVSINVAGKIEADTYGIYVNGNLSNATGPVPEITVTETANINSKGDGIYAAGYSKWALAGNVTARTAVVVRSGELTFKGGTYTSTMLDTFEEVTIDHTGGAVGTGAALSVSTANGYGASTIDIQGGTFVSTNGPAIYEYAAPTTVGGEAPASKVALAVTNGDFTSGGDYGPLLLTAMNNPQVVSGGTFSKPVELAYCAPGYIPVFKDGKYTVDGSAVAAVANTAAPGAYLGYDTLKALIDAATDGTEVLIVKPDALDEEDANLLKTETGGNKATSGMTAYEVAETLGGTFKVQDREIVYAYQLGIADLDVTESGISVTVRLEEDGAAVTRELAGRKVRVVSDKTVLAEADAFFEEGEVTLTFTNTADVLEFAIEVLSEAEAETPAE